MNKVILAGRLTRDPEIRYSQGENAMAVARYTLAVDRRYKREDDSQGVDFISCVAFRKNAEFAEKYLKKGIKIMVEGRWQTGNYTNKDGVKVYTNDCIVESQEFCERKRPEQGGDLAGGDAYTDADGFMNLPEGIDEELPFV